MFTQSQKRSLGLILLIFFCFHLQAGDIVRLMSYNVRNAMGMDDVRNCQRIANVINNTHPDVVAIQELDSVTARSGQINVLKEIAERTQMEYQFAPAIDYDGGKYGIGLLSKVKPLRVKRLSLPGREERRALLIAEFDNYLFGCTHLSLTEEDRINSLKILRAEGKATGKTFFLAGDFNDEPNSKFIGELKKDFQILSTTNQPTWPADKPTDMLDYIITAKQEKPSYAIQSARVIDEPIASDHRPIIVDIAFATPEGR